MTIAVGMFDGMRILMLVYRQYSQYISFQRSFDWWWSRGGGLDVYKTGRNLIRAELNNYLFMFRINCLSAINSHTQPPHIKYTLTTASS